MRSLCERMGGQFCIRHEPEWENVLAHVSLLCNENFQEEIRQGSFQDAFFLSLAPCKNLAKAFIVNQISIFLCIEESMVCIGARTRQEIHGKNVFRKNDFLFRIFGQRRNLG